MNNIKQITDKQCCSGCGACVYACSHIKMINKSGFNIPVVDDSCKNCSLCLKLCSSYNSSDKYYDNKFFKNLKDENCYIGYANDETIRKFGASGGVITAFLINLLENNKVDGCIIAYSDGKLENSKAIIATTKEEIISSRSSKYMPISMNVILNQIDKNKKYAYVGKGCDIRGLTLLQDKYPLLQNAIVLKIGLMCAGTPSLEATKNLYKEMTGKDYDAQKSLFEYRYQGWPGNSVAQYENERYELPYSISWGEKLGRHLNNYCRLCMNHLPEDADIVIGDAWYKNKSLKKQEYGYSLIVVVNDACSKYLLKNNALTIKNSNVNDVKFSQEYLFNMTENAFIYDFFANFYKNKNYLKYKTSYKIVKSLIFKNVKFVRYLIGNIKRFNKNKNA